MSDTQRGSCLCGAVQFEIDGAFDSFYLCHCSRCRKDTGSAHAANLFATSAQLHWRRGEHEVSHFKLQGTAHSRSFCRHCGSALPGLHMDGALLVVPAGSLDSEVNQSPTAHIFRASAASWDHELEQLHAFAGLPE